METLLRRLQLDPWDPLAPSRYRFVQVLDSNSLSTPDVYACHRRDRFRIYLLDFFGDAPRRPGEQVQFHPPVSDCVDTSCYRLFLFFRI